MQVIFKIETNEKVKNVEMKFKNDIEKLSTKNKIKIEFEIVEKTDIEKLTIYPFLLTEKKMTDNFQAFHKAYLERFVDDLELELKLLELEK